MGLALRTDHDARLQRIDRSERSERSERSTAVRTRAHHHQGTNKLVKSTAGVTIADRPELVVVAPRGRTARLVVAGCVVVFGMMLGAAAFQTQLARKQLTIDGLDRRIRAAHDQYDVLRRERAELRSPGRLMAQAGALGMVPATQTQFVSLDPDVVATVQRSGGTLRQQGTTTPDQEFQDYATVKAQAGSAP
jgi:hypothetical protein